LGEQELQDEALAVARKHGVRLLGPNIYGYYYTPQKLSATFCTPYDVAGGTALTSQSGGIGMAILGYSRSTRTGVSAIVGVGNKADIDEDDLLTFFGQDDNTDAIAMHLEDLKDGRAFVEAAREVVPRKPVVVLKAGRTSAGARAAGSHTGALAGDDKVYDDILRQAGVVRAPGLSELLEYGRALPVLPAPAGENVVIITGAGGSGVLLSDAVVDNGMSLMEIPPDLDEAFRAVIPPFGAAGNPGRAWATGTPAPPRRGSAPRWSRTWWRRPGPRASTSRWWPRCPGAPRWRRPARTCSSTAWWPTPTPRSGRSRCSARSIAGRAPPDYCDPGHVAAGAPAPRAPPAPGGAHDPSTPFRTHDPDGTQTRPAHPNPAAGRSAIRPAPGYTAASALRRRGAPRRPRPLCEPQRGGGIHSPGAYEGRTRIRDLQGRDPVHGFPRR